MKRILVMVVVLAAGVQVLAQEFDPSPLFNKHDVMIPMRDGVRLHTEIYTLICCFRRRALTANFILPMKFNCADCFPSRPAAAPKIVRIALRAPITALESSALR